jgi:hypothetical protein
MFWHQIGLTAPYLSLSRLYVGMRARYIGWQHEHFTVDIAENAAAFDFVLAAALAGIVSRKSELARAILLKMPFQSSIICLQRPDSVKRS